MPIIKVNQGWPVNVIGLNADLGEQSWIRVGDNTYDVAFIMPSTRQVYTRQRTDSISFDEANLEEVTDRQLAAINFGFDKDKSECHVSLYRTTRHCGGPEEGGWWYDRRHYTGRTCKVDVLEAREFCEDMQESYKPQQPKYNRFSVLGYAGDLYWMVEETPGENDDSRSPKPRYE